MAVTGEGCYPLDRPISAIITASPENGSSLDGEVHVSWEVNDEDSDGHEVLIEIVAETAPSIVLLTCTKTAPEPGPGTCSWTFPTIYHLSIGRKSGIAFRWPCRPMHHLLGIERR